MSDKKRIPRIKFFLNGKSTQVDRFYLDTLALIYFGVKYEDKTIRKRVNKIVRDIMNDLPVQTQIIHQKILASFLPPVIKKQLETDK